MEDPRKTKQMKENIIIAYFNIGISLQKLDRLEESNQTYQEGYHTAMIELGIDHFLTKKLESKLQQLLTIKNYHLNTPSTTIPLLDQTTELQKEKSLSKTSSFNKS